MTDKLPPSSLRIGLPSGSLQGATVDLFGKAGYRISIADRSAFPRLLDGIVDITETGSSIRANNLRVVDTILTSTTRFVANRAAWDVPWKREKMENIAMLLRGAIEARAKVGLKMNVPEMKLQEVVAFLPAEKSPTVSRLSDAGWVAVEVILEERQEREPIPRLKRAGATGI